MEEKPSFGFFRRLLFPYNGDERVTRAQSIRLIVTWVLFFATLLMLATLPVLFGLHVTSLNVLALFLLLVWLFGAIIFGATACFVVATYNRAIELRQKWKEQQSARSSSASGGRYGS